MTSISNVLAPLDFSIIIPARNEEANIVRCLDSISQVEWDREMYEVIVIDNGSSDRTVELAREKGARVTVRPELRIAGLRNLGATQSRGRILAFLDADCAVTKQWLSAAALYLKEGEDVVAFGSPVTVPEGGTWVQDAWFNVRGKPGVVSDADWLESANLFVRRGPFFSVGGFNEELVTCEDYDLTQRLKRVGRLVSDHRVAALHYREPATIKEFVKKEMWRGKNNYTGLLNRKIDKGELPSLVLPLFFLCFVISLLVLLAFSIGARTWGYLPYAGGLLLCWQAPILLVSARKSRSGRLATVFQLLVLFNAYFFARGLVVLRRG